MNWVLIDKICEMTGYSKQAVYGKVKKGTWRRDIHFRKAPDGHLFFSPKAIEQWVEGKV